MPSDLVLTIAQNRLNAEPAGNDHRFLELYGGKEVPVQFWEPDPLTFRCEYYYNARLNELFKRICAECHITGRVDCYWKKISVY